MTWTVEVVERSTQDKTDVGIQSDRLASSLEGKNCSGSFEGCYEGDVPIDWRQRSLLTDEFAVGSNFGVDEYVDIDKASNDDTD